MTNAQLADLLQEAADEALATDGRGRAAIWRVAATVNDAIQASDAFSAWLINVGATETVWQEGPLDHLSIRALRACASWFGPGRDAKPTTRGVA